MKRDAQGAKKSLPEVAWLALILGFVMGAWMVFEGWHRLAYGDYIRLGGRLGPWADLAMAIGLDPMRFGGVFIVWGVVWLITCAGLFLQRHWAWPVAVILAIGSLIYCGVGTVVAAITLILLCLKRSRSAFRTA